MRTRNGMESPSVCLDCKCLRQIVGNGVVANIDCIKERERTEGKANPAVIVKNQYDNQPVIRNRGLERVPPLSSPLNARQGKELG